MDDLLRKWQSLPPVTRTLTATTGTLSVLFLLKVANPLPFVLDRQHFREDWQIWRPLTCIFTPAPGLRLLIDAPLVYRTSLALEERFYVQDSPDYAYHLLLGAASIFGLVLPLKISSDYPLDLTPLLLTLTTLLALHDPKTRITVPILNPFGANGYFNYVTFPRKYGPMILVPVVVMLFVLQHERYYLPRDSAKALLLQALSGIVTAYILYFLRSRALVPTSSRSTPSDRGDWINTFAHAPQWIEKIVGRGFERRNGGQGAGRRVNNVSNAGGVRVTIPNGIPWSDHRVPETRRRFPEQV